MLHTIEQTSQARVGPYTRPAVLTRVEADGDDTCLWVRLEHEHASLVIPARIALQHDYDPRIGDELLVSGEHFRECYVIGVLHPAVTDRQATLKSAGGAAARRRFRDGQEVLSIEDELGRLLFEYDTIDRKCRVYAPGGDLSLAAPDGSIELVAAKGIHCRSLAAITLDSATATQMRVAGADGQSSAISLSGKAAFVNAARLAVQSEQGRIRIRDARYEGDRLSAVLDRYKLLVGKIETLAIRVVERFRNVYRKVDELEQTKAGRVRTLVDNTYQLKTETTYIESRKNVNIDGERIHLG